MDEDTVVTIHGAIDDACLACICQVESNCLPLDCEWDVNSPSCGYCQMKKDYWEDCAKDQDCSVQCVSDYMERYAPECVGDRETTCEDYARIHNRGPRECQNVNTDKYWAPVSDCLFSTYK